MLANAKPFYDLCVNEKVTVPAVFDSFMTKCLEFGYRTIAIDQIIDVTDLDSVGKKNKKGANNTNIIPEPIDLSSYRKFYCANEFTVLHRLTLICKDKENINKIIKSNNFKKYHIFAIIPKSNEVLQYVCNDMDVDIISFDPLDSKGFKFSRRIYKRAVDKGVHFELMYYPAIVDQTLRRNIVSKAHMYHQVGKSQNMIISSGCNSILTLRGPYDVINLGLILGLSEHQSKNAISSAAANVLKHAMSRRIGKAIVFVTKVEKEIPEKPLTDEQIMRIDTYDCLQDAAKKAMCISEPEIEHTPKKMKTNDVIIIDS